MYELPKRKFNRLKDYDYSQAGMYFVTACAKDRAELFGNIPAANAGVIYNQRNVGAATCRPRVKLSECGKILEDAIFKIQNIYDDILVDRYIIMPNHVHMILVINHTNGRQVAAPTVSLVIGNMKRAVSLMSGHSPWQKSFHDHIIRNEQSYLQIAEYIENNALTWESDCFYNPPQNT